LRVFISISFSVDILIACNVLYCLASEFTLVFPKLQWHFYFQLIVYHSHSYSLFNCFLTLFDSTEEGIMIERIGIGTGLGLSLNPGQGVDLSIDQGHVLVHAQRGKFLERSLTYSI